MGDPDSHQPIHIEADQLFADQKKQFARYSGQVHVKQGRFELFADQLDIYSQNNHLKKLVAIGAPARFKKFDYRKHAWTYGQARQIVYIFSPDKTLQLTQQAHIEREGGERLSGEQIIYRITTDTITATGSHQQRVHVVLPGQGERP